MKYRKRLGYTLLECVVYMAASLIIVMVGIKLLFEVKNTYVDGMKKSMEMNVVEEGFHLIDVIADSEVTDVYYENNKIVFYKAKDGGVWESIKVSISDDSLVADYYDIANLTNSKATNSILTGVKGSRIMKKGKLIYLIIERKGEKFIKCI